ncbi:MAG: glycine cleavage system protein GcvH [Candidatus Margulisiibacteriota bacterium]
MSQEFPADIMYSKEHEWVKIDGENALIGITDYAQEEMGDVVFVELPELGKDIEQMEELGVVESVKTISTVYSPVSGEVLEINEKLQETPEIINESPYEDGWIVKLALSDTNEVDDLMTADEYQEYIQDGAEE